MMTLRPEVDFSDRGRIQNLMDGMTELFGEGVKRDGTDLWLLNKEELGTIATFMTNTANGEIMVVIKGE